MKSFKILFWLVLLASAASAQALGLKVCEEGASPSVCKTGIKEIYVTAGTLTITGQKATIAIGGGGGGLTIGTTTITSGTNTRVIYNNSGVVGEYAITGTGNVVMSASPTTTGTLAADAATFAGSITQTSNSATAFQSGPNGGTNPVFRLVNSTASSATGISITGNAAGSGVAIATLSSGASENLSIASKGTAGTITLTAGSGSGSLTATASGATMIVGQQNGAYGVTVASGPSKAIRADPTLYDYAKVSFGSAGLLTWQSGTNWYEGSTDLTIRRAAAANLAFGAADAASPVAQTLSVQNVATGTSNTAGANWTFAGSRGTGTGAGGDIIFQTAPAGSTGTSQNALSAAFTVNNDGTISPKTVTFANLPTVGNGKMIFCSDCTIASPCASGGSGAFAKGINGAWVCN